MLRDGIIVRGLWGEPGIPGYESSLQAIRDTVDADTWQFEAEHSACWCYGVENTNFVADFGVKWTCLNQECLVNWNGLPIKPRLSSEDGRVHWGVSHWRHKLECVRAALAPYDQVLWLDWDCRQVAPLPPGFWRTLANGPPYRASLRVYRRPQINWRETREANCLMPHGAWQYFRRDWIDAIIECHATACPTSADEAAGARLIDNIHGGWIGPDQWRKLYEPWWYDQGREFRQVHRPRGPVCFRNMGRF